MSPGSVFFLPNGTKLINKLISFMKLQQSKQEFEEVITPLIYKKRLWEISGHWENYKNDMFKVEGNDLAEDELTEDSQYGLKPMNCPGHCLIFSRFDRSHNELPIRYSDYSSLHRNETSGSLTGLTRVRRFHQDDGHIFCTQEQIFEEIDKTLKLINLCYRVFDLNDYELYLSTRPEKFIGKLEEWCLAEENLKKVLDRTGKKWTIREGDGAFYGPKIDVLLTDNFGKKHQVGTIQLDFQLPQRFDLKYRDDIGNFKRPIMIHRAIYGSLERFLALLIDHYQGKWPFWLNPKQCVIIPINNEKHLDRALELQQQLSGNMIKDSNQENIFENPSNLTNYKFEVDVDKRNETVGLRIKDSVSKAYNYIILIGDKELETGEVSIRSRSSKSIKTMTVEAVFNMFKTLEDNYE
ncbi:hypothetical protein PACTADRAFT_50730 [Pachysolen tannophilus NRRL Y-2460]|uniref:threonine--tRNA ligase n=1 Tax=Pachysolen tannophilus NRRL Y-2460 TaxID=669874 RepID=A0A1E4TT71_PACTA|nr:hypothetical protein PACTADRAFT_50730 [Pachysolen tannophilus NRRL Y-2460]